METRAYRSLPFLLGAFFSGCGSDPGPRPTTTRPPAITVTSLTGPMADVTVVFHDASGAPVVVTKTNKAGRATGDIDSGGMVTVLLEDAKAMFGATFVGVERDDELTVSSPFGSTPDIGTALGMKTSATKHSIFRAVRKMRQALEPFARQKGARCT